jgi:hypothetical protein
MMEVCVECSLLIRMMRAWGFAVFREEKAKSRLLPNYKIRADFSWPLK